MEKKHLCILICFLANALAMAGANNRTITGVVLSGEDDQPLIGASIFVPSDELQKAGASETSLGTITDLDGKFSISVPENITNIHCSYIGFEEQVIKLQTGKNDYRIVLQMSSHTLGDVVVTGYQELERRKLTAAISKVDVTDAMLGSAKSIDQALAGQIAGVAVTNTSGAPGSPARIRIRGTASLNGTQDPLWVLDGIPLEGTDIPKIDGNNDNDILNIGQSSIAGLSPNDIENITILKDAAATAIYGARAANGVIVITTKRGRSGKPVVNFNTKLTYTPNLDTSRLNLMNAQEKVDLELQLMKEGPYYMWDMPFPTYTQKGGVASILKEHNLMDIYQEKGWNALTPEAQNAINRLKTVNTDWNDILFRDAFTQEYNVSISGGSEKVTYYNSLGYTKEDGNVPGVSMSRFNLTSKTSYQVNKLLKLGVSIFANRRKNQSFVSDTYGLINPIYYSRIANPYFDPYDENGNYLYDYDVVSNNETDLKQGFNIFEERENTSNESITTAINSIFNVDLRFNDQWKVTSQIGVQWDQLSREEYVGMNTFNMRNLRENNTYYKDGKRTYLIPEGGRLKSTNSVNSQITWKIQGEYKQTFNDIHEIQVMGGSEIRKNWYDSQASTGYGYDPKTLTFKNLIFKDETQASSKDWPLKTKSYKENAFASFYANGSYSLMNRYTLGGSIRMDGSDLFGVDKKYRFLPIYSVSGLWRLSNEPFIQKFKWIDNLALRFSYGLQGNIDKNTSPFLLGTYGNISILPGTSEDNITINSAPNSKLRWEKTSSYNLGLDFSVLNQAINMSVDYYYRKGTDLIGNKMLPLENGFNQMTINWASMENKGIEVNLQTRNITTRDFSWYTSFNFAYNKNKVLKVMNNKGDTYPSLEGYSSGAIFVLKTKGIKPETGQILFEDKNGKAVTAEELFQMTPIGDTFYDVGVSQEEQREFYSYAGTTDAPYTGGFMNTFNYRNWELNVNFSYNVGAHVRTSPSYDIADLDPAHNLSKDILNRWTPENQNSNLPALVTPNYNTADYRLFSDQKVLYRSLDIWVKKLSYMRLQNLRLAYHIPSEWLHKLNIGGATVAIEARNLFIISSNYKNYMDPESMSNLYATPVPKSVTFNLSLNF
ncbi:SusC/RagA family TonB-linked outer membrane protein [Bacteroides bouchesdurhonensis]|uniref:SusC/RagA family TonB-linked outer membrane protein n=1 Tax=Bacteroides bouchesdurhonensis TaxID=1841855 RepID=UPI00097F895B|nr:SusC/RagA family TonB-linked outer membrane protein [Bacteroides bouchesdurhonensis]